MLGLSRVARMERAERPADDDARPARRPRRRVAEAGPLVCAGRLLRVLREQRRVIEVVLDVRRRLDEPEPQAFGDIEIRFAARTVQLQLPGELLERSIEIGDA